MKGVKLLFFVILVVLLVGCSDVSTYEIARSEMDVKVRRYVCDIDSLEVEYEAIVNSCGGEECSNTVTCITYVDQERAGAMFYLNGFNGLISGYRKIDVPKDGSDHSLELCCFGGYSSEDIEGEGADCAEVEIFNEDVERNCP